MLDKIGKTNRYFNAFITFPEVEFNTQQDGEKVILILRAHPFTQIPWMINMVFILFLLFIGNLFFDIFLSSQQILFLNLLILLIVLAYGWINFLSWFFNIGLITNKRIIDIDYHPISYREVTGTQLRRVEDITSKAGGFFASVFNYGDLFIQTAGTEPNIEFLNIPSPGTVVRIINELMGKR